MSEEKLISVDKALKLLLKESVKPSYEVVPLQDSINRILGEDISADRDFPPFDRVMMDGIAIKYESYEQGQREYKVTAFQPAGTIQNKLHDHEACIEVMTGSILPVEADTVIPYENVEINNGKVVINSDYIIQGHHIHKLGSDRKKGDLLLKKHSRITPAEVGVLATAGKHEVKVLESPKIAIVSTGDELVDVDVIPAAHQIRKSNVYSLLAALEDLKLSADVFHLRDDQKEIDEKLDNILSNYEVVMLSGGVSKGKKDFLPEALNKLKIKTKFHRVAQRPGKPMFFGTGKNTIVFGFPGNPVSTFVCCYRYFYSWFYKNYKITHSEICAMLEEDLEFSPSFTYFLTVKLSYDKEGHLCAKPIPGHGSGDLANLLNADGFLELPATKSSFKKGEVYPLIQFRK